MSTDVARYISSPADNNTLDYIVVPASVYVLGKVTCPKSYVSDHRAVVATIDIL